MKTSSLFSLAGILSLSLAACNPNDPQASSRWDEDSRRQLEETRAAYEKQAAEMEARSSKLAADLADLQQAVRDKENADLTAKLQAMKEENERLQADADEARRRSEEAADQLATLTNTSSPTPVSGPSVADADSWNDPSADYTPFYEELTPYGRWLDVEGYGYAWHPNVAERTSWQPYVDGRWAWSDQGWAWDSNESFGWACYHYGRWVRIARHGWVWVPGREWAPAWVAWRFGDDCVGWAPLPPGRHRRFVTIGSDCDAYYHLSPSSYTFIQAQHFGRPSYLNVCLPITRVTQVFQNTVNVTNIVRITSPQNNFFIHRGGPDRDWLERRMGGRVPRAEVQVVNHLDRAQPRHPSDRRSPEGVTQLTAAPLPMARGSRPAPPKVERITRPALVDAWADVPADRRKALRDQVNRQSREQQPAVVNPAVVTQVKDPTPRENTAPALGGVDRRPDNGTQPAQIPLLPRPGIPQPGGRPTTTPDRVAQQPRETLPSRPATPQGGGAPSRQKFNDDPSAAMQRQQAEIAQQQQQRELQQQEAARKQAEAAAAMKESQANEAQKMAEAQRRQREAEIARARESAAAQQQMQKQAQEQKRLQDAQRDAKAAAESARIRQATATQRQQMAQQQQQQQAAADAIKERQAETLRRQQESEAKDRMQAVQDERARQQQEMAAQVQQEQARAAIMRQQQEAAQRRAAAESARQQAATMRQQQQEAAQRSQREAAQHQQEQANAAAMRQQQEAAQRQANAEAARQAAAMRQQQEAAQRAQQESARRAAEEAARRSSEEAARRQRDNNRDDSPKRSR